MFPVPPVRVEFRRARKVIPLAPLHVELFNGKDEEEFIEVGVGKFGKLYPLKFKDLMNLIRSRQGCPQKRLEFKK